MNYLNLFVTLLFYGLYSLAFLFTTQRTYAQQYSEETSISLLTCEPGQELYSSFGHTAIRIKDPVRHIDMVYNYGLFDFDTPNFYSKFVRGKLLYKLGRTNYHRFIREYQRDGRKVTEQQLNLTTSETVKLTKLLKNNYLPENRYYLYDFLYDNCATRVRDIVEKALDKKLHYPKAVTTNFPTFRQLLDSYLTEQVWTDFGIDLILGLPADKKATIYQQMFLPDYVLKYLGKSTVLQETGYEDLVKTTTLLNEGRQIQQKATSFSPFMAFSILLGLVLWMTFKSKKEQTKQWLDTLLFSILAIVGLILSVGWLGTDHKVMAYNLNILWANPLYFLFVAVLWKNHQQRIQQYAKVIFGLAVLLLLLFPIFPQQFNIGILPILVMLVIRSWDNGFATTTPMLKTSSD